MAPAGSPTVFTPQEGFLPTGLSLEKCVSGCRENGLPLQGQSCLVSREPRETAEVPRRGRGVLAEPSQASEPLLPSGEQGLRTRQLGLQ